MEQHEYEKMIIHRLIQYLKKERITQKEAANRLDWTAQDLNNILKGRSPIGKARQLHIAKKLGISLNIDPTSNLDEDDIEIAEMAHHLTKGQKDALKSIIHELAKKQSEAA